jgi:hypothetical protein
MKINYITKEEINLVLLATLIFSIKPLEFLAINFSVANFIEDLIYPMIFHLVIFFIYIIFFIFSLKFKILLLNKLFIFTAAIYYIQYFTLDIRSFVSESLPIVFSANFALLLSLLTITLISFFFTKTFFSSKNKHLFIYGAALLCLSQVLILASNITSTHSPKKTNQLDIEYIKVPQSVSSAVGENVYYIILDGLISYEYFLEMSNDEDIAFQGFNKTLQDYDFKVFQDSLSSYNMTYLTLGSILEMNYYDSDLTYNNRDNFFPKMLYKHEPPKLLKELNNIGYEFIYSGNFWAQCKNSLNFSCGNRIVDYNKFNFFKKVLYYTNNAGIQTFTSKSLLGFVIRTLLSKFGSSFNDDGLDNFLMSGIEFIKPNTKKFYFIHNESPHPPYPEDNCQIDHTKSSTGWGDIKAYSYSISCALNKTLFSINKILEIDPSAIIVIQGDHGTAFEYDWDEDPLVLDKAGLKERFSIYNSVKIPKRCNPINLKSIGNVETINIVFDCIANKNNTVVPNKSFAGVYENNKNYYGKLYDVTDSLN